MSKTDHYTIRPWLGLRHPISGLTHLGGALFAAYAMVSLLRAASETWSAWGVGIFAGSMFCLYLASSLYHLWLTGDRGTFRLRQLDHSMIYVFIAGCYTPFCLILFRDTKFGWPVLIAVWTCAALGVVAKLVIFESSRWIRVFPYVAMSWMGVFLLPAMLRTLPPEAILWLAAGGAAYSVGAAVYAIKRPDPWPKVFGFHEIWHVCVLLGTICHFVAIRHYLV